LVDGAGGPRASRPASAGLKRSANLLDFDGSLVADVEVADSAGFSVVACLLRRMLFCREIASGVASCSFTIGGWLMLSDLPLSVLRLAIASGMGGGSDELSALL
jgi:hypothetical protein